MDSQFSGWTPRPREGLRIAQNLRNAMRTFKIALGTSLIVLLSYLMGGKIKELLAPPPAIVQIEKHKASK